MNALESAFVAAHPVLRIGVDAGYAPYSYFDTNGDFNGVAAEFVARIESLLGIRFKPVGNLSWPQILRAAADKRLDVIATAVKLPERESYLAFTQIYLPTPLVILTRKDETQINASEDLGGHRVALVKGYSSTQQVIGLLSDIQPVLVETPLEGLRSLSAGQTDAYIGVLGVSSYLAEQNGIGNLHVANAFDMQTNGQRFAVRKDWPVLARLIDRALKAIPQADKAAIFKRWLPVTSANTSLRNWRYWRWVEWFAIVLVLALGLFALWHWQLKIQLAQRTKELHKVLDERNRSLAAREQTLALLEQVQREQLATTHRLQSILEHTPANVFIKHADGRYLYINENLARQWGVTKEQVIGKTDHDLIDAGLADELRTQDRQVLSSGTAGTFDLELPTANGRGNFLTVKFPISAEVGSAPHALTQLCGIGIDTTGHKRAEAQIRAHHQILESVFQSIPDLFFRLTADGTILDYLANRDDDLYLPPEAFLERRMQDVLPPPANRLFARKIRQAVESGHLTSFVYALTVAAGQRHYEARLKRVAAGSEIVVIIRDITAQYQDQQALKRSRADLARAQFIGGLGNWSWDVNGGGIEWSEQLYRILGMKPQQPVLGYRQFITRVHAQDRLAFRTYSRELLHSKPDTPVSAFRYRVVLPNGEIRWLETFVEAEFTEQGHLARLFGTVQDISEDILAQQNLQAQTAHIQTLLNTTHDGYILADAQGRIEDVNPAYCELLGYQRDELIGMTVAQIEVSLTETQVQERIEVMRATGGARFETRHRHRDGRVLELEVSITLMERNDQPLFAAFVHDITVRKQVTAELDRAYAELEQRVSERTAELSAANQELEAFSYSVSHDLRAPLRAIQGFEQALMEDFHDNLPPQAQEYLQEIAIGSRRMNEQIEGLLALSRSTRSELQRENVRLDLLVLEIHSRFCRRAPERKVHFSTPEPLPANADIKLLKSLLEILLENAWKYTSGTVQAEITFLSRMDNAEIIYALRDNGCGFDMRFADKLFQPFQRLHNQSEYPGLGIGLATAQRIVRRHGGWIQGQGQPGGGACFEFTLSPAQEAKA